MSNNADESPRRLSLLTHFRESRSPPYVDVATDTAHSQHNTLRYQDDEAQCGFWGEDTSAEYEKEYSASGWDKFFYTLLQVMLVIVIALNLDVIMSKWGMGTMNWRGSTKMQRVNTVQVHLCLTNPEKNIPSQQMWRIISHDSLSQCETEILTFYAAPSEAFKMGLLDEILVEPSEI